MNMIFCKIKFNISEKLRFIISGILNNGIGFSLYLLSVEFGMHPKLSMGILYWGSVFASFFINRNYVFADKGNPVISFFRYFAVYLIGYLVSFLFMTIFFDWYGLNHVYSILIVTGLMVLYFYFLQKYFVFRPK